MNQFITLLIALLIKASKCLRSSNAQAFSNAEIGPLLFLLLVSAILLEEGASVGQHTRERWRPRGERRPPEPRATGGRGAGHAAEGSAARPAPRCQRRGPTRGRRPAPEPRDGGSGSPPQPESARQGAAHAKALAAPRPAAAVATRARATGGKATRRIRVVGGRRARTEARSRRAEAEARRRRPASGVAACRRHQAEMRRERLATGDVGACGRGRGR